MDRKKSIVIFPADIKAATAHLSRSQRGDFLDGMCDQNFFGSIKTKIDEATLEALNIIQSDIDKNNAKYMEILETRRINGSKGGKKRAENAKQHLNSLEAKSKQATKSPPKHTENEAVDGDESDTVFIKNNKNKGAENVDNSGFVGAPSVEDVADYCQSSGYTIDPIAFVNWHVERGWRHGKKYMAVDWQKAVRKWYCKENGLSMDEMETMSDICGGILSRIKVVSHEDN